LVIQTFHRGQNILLPILQRSCGMHQLQPTKMWSGTCSPTTSNQLCEDVWSVYSAAYAVYHRFEQPLTNTYLAIEMTTGTKILCVTLLAPQQ